MKTSRPKERESDILRTITDGLSAMHIWWVRMNSGAMVSEYRGKKRMLRFGRKGMGDILALVVSDLGINCYRCEAMNPLPMTFTPTWFECKTATGEQTADQMEFQHEVEQAGHHYFVVRSWEDVLEALR